jgi:signal transduction histidine kinase
VQDRVFEPFVTARPMGTGLGLAIVRRVIDEHRGSVELASPRGRGTRCVIELPLTADVGLE